MECSQKIKTFPRGFKYARNLMVVGPKFPTASKYPIFEVSEPKYKNSMDLRTRSLNYWVLGPSGYYTKNGFGTRDLIPYHLGT